MIIYLTTNLINNKKYIGKDSHNDDKYLGSGLILKQAIKKYGIENFKKEILCVCSSEQELNEKEKYYIEFFNAVNDKNFYNMMDGGHGGKQGPDACKKISQSLKNHPMYKSQARSKKLSIINKKSYEEKYGNRAAEVKNKISNTLKGRVSPNKDNILSDETKNKISKGLKKSEKFLNSQKERDRSGNKNPMFGKSLYSTWLEKYGKDEADKREQQRYEKWLTTKFKKENEKKI